MATAVTPGTVVFSPSKSKANNAYFTPQPTLIANLPTNITNYNAEGQAFFIRNCTDTNITLDLRGLSNEENAWAEDIILPPHSDFPYALLEVKTNSGNFPAGLMVSM